MLSPDMVTEGTPPAARTKHLPIENSAHLLVNRAHWRNCEHSAERFSEGVPDRRGNCCFGIASAREVPQIEGKGRRESRFSATSPLEILKFPSFKLNLNICHHFGEQNWRFVCERCVAKKKSPSQLKMQSGMAVLKTPQTMS